jgi:hypothetical protein
MQTRRSITPALEQVRHLDKLLDEALADSFPASDPVSSLATDDPLPSGPRESTSSPREPLRNDAREIDPDAQHERVALLTRAVSQATFWMARCQEILRAHRWPRSGGHP